MAYTAMMADPLNAPTVGKPDFNSVPTNATQLRDVHTLASTANGEVFVLIQPHTSNCTYINPVITAGAVTGYGAGANSQYHADIVANNVGIRTLAYVVEWQPTLSAMNASGRLFIGQYNTSSSSLVPLQALSAYFDDDGLAASATSPAVQITRHTGDIEFLSPASNADAHTHASAVLVIVGLPKVAQDVGQLVVTRIVELVPMGTTLAKGQAAHTPCNMADCCVAANIVGRAATRGSGAEPYQKIRAAAMKLAGQAAKAYLTGPAGVWSELARMVVS